MICEYGCGQEAQYQFKNGKWCCSKSTNQCPIFKKNHSSKMKGRILNEEHKNKISEKNIGKLVTIETRQKMSNSRKNVIPWNKGKTGIYSKETLYNMGSGFRNKNMSKETCKKMSESTKGQIPWIKGKQHTKNTIIKLSLSIKKIKEKYPLFYKIEKMRYNPDKPGEKEIQVHCKNHNCINSKENNGWFTPTKIQFFERKRQIEDFNGNSASYFYCSDECKHSCLLFGKSVNQLIKQDQINAGFTQDLLYTSDEYQIYRQEVLVRASNKCEYCDKQAEHVHHSRPQKLEPGFVLDPDFGIACCKECHYKYGHKDECSTGALANINCK